MKKLLFVTVILCSFTTASNAQDGGRIFKKFKGDLSLGYAKFSSDADIKNGFVIALEPKYQVLDQLAIGIRVESVLLGDNNKDQYGDDNFKLKAFQSGILTSDFYFTKEYKLRPFLGAGGGLYTVISTNTDYDYSDNDDNGKRKFLFGGMARAGVEIKHLKIAFEYNFIPNTSNTYRVYGGNVTEKSYNSYFSVKAGFCFSGGPNKK